MNKRTKTPYGIMKQEERILDYYRKTRLQGNRPTKQQMRTYRRIQGMATRYIVNIRKHVGYVVYCPDYNPAFADITREIYAGY